MLKIDRTNGKLLRITRQSMSDGGIKERSDLQELIFQNPDEFFHHECKEDIFLLAAEVEPSSVVADRIDLLALDAKGNIVVIELKRGSHKLQLLQALSYAAMVADQPWREISKLVDTNRLNGLNQFLSDNDLDPDLMTLNKTQRIVLIAESYDYEVLKTAQWLTDHSLLNITCYEVALAKDPATDTDYLSAVQLFPPKPLAEQARLRGAQRSQEASEPSTLEMKLERCASSAIRGLFEALLTATPRRNKRRDALVYPPIGKMRLRLKARRDYAHVSQLGRFEGDELLWNTLSAPKLRVEPKRLRFRVYTESDIQILERFIRLDLPHTIWTTGLTAEEEAAEEEDAEA